MHGASIRASAAALVVAVALLVGTASAAVAQNNRQSGLVNVNVQELALQVPVSVALPIGLAANVCGVSVLSLQEGDNTCIAQTNSLALSRAVADAMLGTGGNGGNGGGPRNNQSGLINVNIQDVIIQVPVSVALPIGVAANVCGISVLAIQEGDNECTAENTSQAFSRSLAEALLAANP